jgi:alpha-L-fucosidase
MDNQDRAERDLTMHVRRMWKCILVLLCLSATAQAVGGGDGRPDLKTCQNSLDRWRSLRVGAFIHWTPYVLASGEKQPAAGIDKLYKEFTAEHFDAGDWVRMLKASGFRYMVYTTKHGDSCCMWNTKETDYNIMNSPMARDVVGELSAACKKEGMPFCPYYALHNDSQNHPDWTYEVDLLTGEPDYKARSKPGDPAGYHLAPDEKRDFGRYFAHVKAQMKELSDNYGPFLAWWFDQRCPTLNHLYGTELYAFLRSLQPDVLTSNRVDTPFGRGLDYPTWFVTEAKSAGDYAVSEIAMPRFNRDIPWEYCQAAGKPDGWFWNPSDVYRPLEAWIRELVEAVCRDGNYIVGFGAMPDGKYEPRLVEQLGKLGGWLERHGDSVYGTRGGPFLPNSLYGSTCRGNTVYVHVFKTGGNQTLTLPPIGRRLVGSRLMDGGTLEARQGDEGITLKIGRSDLQSPDTVVVLELDGSAEEMAPVGEKILTAGAHVCASSVRENKKEYGPELAVDGKTATYWTTDEGVTNGWLEYDLGKPCTFSRAIVDEGEDYWIRHIQIETKTGNDWKTVFEWQPGNPELWKDIPMEVFSPEFRFGPVTAQSVRLKIVKAVKSPVVREFKLYER